MQDVSFGFQAAASDVAGVPDAQLYRELMADCDLGHRLGFDAAWLLEHHFSDYYPTPSPLLFMAHIAADFPTSRSAPRCWCCPGIIRCGWPRRSPC